jgi:enterochelin esterase-like enzyme
MGLTSAPFMSLMGAAAAGSLACIVWLWPRLAGRRLADVGARLGLIAIGQVLVIAALLVCLNGYFTFYGSWSALFGTGAPRPLHVAGTAVLARPIAVTETYLGPVPGGGFARPGPPGSARARQRAHDAGQHKMPGPQITPSPGARISAARVSAARVSPAPASAGEMLKVNLTGQRTGIGVAADYVYLPPQYFQRAYARARFPVVLALTGYPNDPWSFVQRLALPATAARLVAAGRIRPAIYVMMNVSVSPPRDTECTNVPAGPQAESFFAEDVPWAVERTFRAQSSASGWAVLGFSTGGYCAAKLAMMYPGQFSSAVSLAGYYNAVKDQTTGNIYGGSQAYRDENNLDWRLAHLPAPPVSVLVTSSRSGEKDLPGTLAFLGLIHSPMRGYSLLLRQGGHNYGSWDRELPQSLEWLSHRLTPATPDVPQVVLGAG